MNYFDIINKCLLELSYKQVSSFTELTKNDHKKLKHIVNIINNTVCRFEDWNFLVRTTTLEIPANTSVINNTVNGKIIKLIIDNDEYKHMPDFENYIAKPLPQKSFTAMGDKLIFPEFKEAKTANIAYYTTNAAISTEGEEKLYLENETDRSLIPEPFVEPLLIYGACMRIKGNPQHVKFNYWYGMYKEALADLKAHTALSVTDFPRISVSRKNA